MAMCGACPCAVRRVCVGIQELQIPCSGLRVSFDVHTNSYELAQCSKSPALKHPCSLAGTAVERVLMPRYARLTYLGTCEVIAT